VRTDGPDGVLKEYEISYTFGVRPLQQYLVEFPDGRLQTLALCWDTRPPKQGGQRWFHIYPDEDIKHGDELHWTGRNQNWNYMCAECHSTRVRKNYDFSTNSFSTTWSEIDVSCEACHGPGSRHADWAEAEEKGEDLDDYADMGLAVRLKDPDRGTWVFDPGAPVASRTTPLRSTVQVELCARCHARRVELSEDYQFGRPLMNTHYPEMLEERLYHADGQILDEVYVYGSFRQSKMYQKGVVCSDCHEPHSAKVYAPGNALCYRCHLYESYGTRAHHFHNPDSTGGSCVECHAPESTYMVIDPRRDHSFRNPRPDLTIVIGVPNTCNRCHRDKTVEWAADSVARWYGPRSKDEVHYGQILHAGRLGAPGSEQALTRLAGEGAAPAIVRATAVSLLGQYSDASAVRAMESAVYEKDPSLRVAGVRAMEILEPDRRFALAKHLLKDDLRVVRLEAARSLAPVSERSITPADKNLLVGAIKEYVESQMFNADRPESHVNLGNLYVARRMTAEAESAYAAAIRLDPRFMPAYVNLADLYRVQSRDREGEEILREALRISPDFPQALHALGLLLVREKRSKDALPYFERAHRLRPADASIGYVYGIALQSAGRSEESVSVLEESLAENPYDRDLLYALVTIHRDRNEPESARLYAGRLLQLYPDNQAFRQLYQRLGVGN
jgi:predicted CXXCH cytochrome family protein